MNRKWNNLPRFTAVLLLIVTVIGIVYLYQQAPSRADDIGNVTIRTQKTTHLVLNGNQFNCPNPDGDERTLTCSVLLENQTLAMQLTTTQGVGSTITDCNVTFGGRTIACRGDYSMRYWGPIVIIEETLNISPDRFAELRQIHWPDQLSEAAWLRITLLFISLLVLNAAVLLWQALSDREVRPGWRAAVTVFGSAGFFLFFRLSSTVILLFQGWID